MANRHGSEGLSRQSRASARTRFVGHGQVLKTSDDLDLALLELESLPRGTTAATLAGPILQAGDSLLAIGNRIDLETVWNRSAGPLRTTGRLKNGYFWRGKKLAANAQVSIGQWPIEEGTVAARSSIRAAKWWG